jgi:hypothetical protein
MKTCGFPFLGWFIDLNEQVIPFFKTFPPLNMTHILISEKTLGRLMPL